MASDRKKRYTFFTDIRRNPLSYGMLIPAALYTILFGYLTIPFMFIAFEKFNYRQGSFGSEWAGLSNFEFFFKSNSAPRVIGNTVFLNLMFIIFTLPTGKAPIPLMSFPCIASPSPGWFRTLDTYPFTVLSDLISVDQEGNVKNWIETEEFKICADFFATLYDGGYISPDILSTSWSSWNQLCSGNFIWCDGCQMWGTEEYFQSLIPGCELDSIYLNPDATSFRPSAFRNSTGVSATSEHPAEAVQFMNWLYSEQDNYDAVVYGIEGVDWKDEGDRHYTKLNATGEAFNDDWMIGNLSLLRTEVGTYPTFIDIMYTEKTDAVDSIVMNFTFDPTPVSTEYANCLALVTSDIYPIKLGIVKYDDGAVRDRPAQGRWD